MPQPLSSALREATAAAHKAAETSTFVDELMSGRSCVGAYAMLTAQLAPIYQALESAIHQRFAEDPLLARLSDTRLDRYASLEADLDHLIATGATGGLSREELPVMPATQDYVEQLAHASDVETIIANHYVRYLGDLSGGQAIGALVKRHYSVADAGVSFYRFADIDSPKRYKDGYRARLDALEVTPGQRELLLRRAVAAFAMNQALFADLDRSRDSTHQLVDAGR
ncbi:MAG: heme oxygenase (biliverdin-producing) [Arachnia sp.]